MPQADTKYEVGTELIFQSKHGESSKSGEKVRVIMHGNASDGSGISHGVEFADGHQMWAYPQELEPIEG